MSSARPLFVCLLFITACSSAAATTGSSASTSPERLPVMALPGYDVSVFTQADSRLIVANPDAIEVDGQHVVIDYQNTTAKDCTDGGSSTAPSSTVVEYDMSGKILNHWAVPGHSGGMRVHPRPALGLDAFLQGRKAKFATID